MSKRTTLLAPLVTVPLMSLVLVVVAVQRLPRRVDASLPSSGTVPRGVTGTPGATATQDRIREIQSLGLEDIQARIRASDEEWKVIGPKLRKVMMASAAVEASIEEPGISGASSEPGFVPWGPGRPGGPGGPPGGPGNDSFAGPGENAPLGRGGPGPGGFEGASPGPGGFGPDDPGPEGFGPGGAGPGGFGPGGPGGPDPNGFGRGGPGPGGGPPGFGGPGNTVMQRLTELRTALADPNATSEQLKEKITAVRDARRKARAELAAARKDLLELLTLDQEAMLVSLDYLD